MRTAGAILVFCAVSVSSAVVLAFPLGGLSAPLAWAAFAFGLVAAGFAWRGIHPPEHPAPNAWDILLFTVFALASLRAFLWLIYPVGDELRILSPNNLGDLSLHLQLIRYLGGGVAFWPASPILSGVPLTYPLGADLFNSLLLLTGVPVERGLIWVGLVGAGLSAWSLWRWGGAFAMAALLFNGGLAGFLLLPSGLLADLQDGVAWKNLFLAMLVTQRGLLFALPIGLFLLSAWRDELFGRGSGVPAWTTCLLYATMPLFNVHAFLFLSLVLAAAFLLNPGKRIALLVFVAAAFVPASAAMFFVSGHFAAAGGLRWLPGWMQDGWFFWLKNFGISLPLLGLLAWQMVRRRSRVTLCFAGTGVFVFLLCCLISFAPWAWDNTKLFLWAWLACAPFLWEMIARWPVGIRVLVCFVLFFSGAVALVSGLDGRHGYKLASRSELAETANDLARIPFGDRIAVKPDYNNPVILLGHPVLCGYEGHLTSHGLDYRRQWDALHVILKQAPGWQDAMAMHNIRWIYLNGPPARLIPRDASLENAAHD